MVKLQDYLPDYYDDNYEMQHLVLAEQIDFSDFDSLIYQTLLNQFVVKADGQGLALFEDELGIVTNPTDTLENRRFRILTQLMPPRPITIRYFKELLQSFKIQATLVVDYLKSYVVAKAKRSEITKDQIKQLRYLLNIYLPANLAISIVTTAEAVVNNQQYYGTKIVTAVATSALPKTKFKTRNTLPEQFGVTMPLMQIAAISKMKGVDVNV
ncbi:putative phage tail protein [Agrilactobacillus fermenti]|uniref:putative phage tail protein n=1 Tax=Agrilactobacillus fermenti TaxID=2586909 RepID=UPI003A5C72DC